MEIKNIVLGIAIVILTTFVTIYGISIFYPVPQYEDFCPRDYPAVKLPSQDVCPEVCIPLYEIESNECIFNDCGSGCGADNINTFETLEECQKRLNHLNCYEEYDEARKSRAKNIFYISIPLGILILVIGGFLFHLEAVGAGLMGGGVTTIIYGAGSYWRYGDDLFRFIISLIGLISLIYITYWFNKKHHKKNH